jgi:hypothetical protein
MVCVSKDSNSILVVEKSRIEGDRSWKLVPTVLRNSLHCIASTKDVAPPKNDFEGSNFITHESNDLYKGIPYYTCGFIGCVKVA